LAFLGAIIQTVKGGVEKFSNESTISDLERDLAKDLFEDFSEEEKLDAQIKLKQADLELAEIQGKSRLHISTIEKELIALMEKNIKLKMEKLKQKEATQLDIANTMIAIQKTNNDLKNSLVNIEEVLNSKYNKQSSKIDLLSQSLTKIQNLEQYNQKTELKQQNEISSLKNSLEENGQAIFNNHVKLGQISTKQNQLKKEIKAQQTELSHFQNDLFELGQRIESNESNILNLLETTKVQRWFNRITLFMALGGLIVGIINLFLK